MFLVSTLCSNRAIALKLLREVPDYTVILFPESVPLLSRSITQYSIDKNLFIIFNNDVVIEGKTYIAMRAIDKGEYQWTVRKFKLWHSDFDDGFTPSKPEPFVTIRGRKSGVFICYDAVTLFKEYRQLIDNQIELLLIPSNWDFNFELMERIIDFSIYHITTLKAVVFSNSNTFSLIKTQNKERRITKTGYVQLRI